MRTAAGAKPPTRELGAQVDTAQGGLLSWGALGAGVGDSLERTAALQWPRSIWTYADMINDSQVEGLKSAVQLPIMRMNWYLKRNGASPETVARISQNYGLPIEGENPNKNKGRTKGRFKFKDHLEHALDAIIFGFMIFEQFGIVTDDLIWNLRKLAPRLPQTISEINLAPDGGIKNVRVGWGLEAPLLPIESLVIYSWQRRGANWTGRSMLRSCYGPWLLKNRVQRVGAINIERNGAGTPIIEAPQSATPDELAALDRMAQRFKAGSRAGGAIPNGAKLTLMGISGGQPDAEKFIRLCNEEMARSFLAMFMQLGQTDSGSRALGDTFVEFFSFKLEAVADWFKDIFNEHVIEDDVDWNDAEDAPAPLLAWSWGDSQLPTDQLCALVDSGVLQVDDELESAIRLEKRLPPRSEPRQVAPAVIPAADPAADPTSPAAVAARAGHARAGRVSDVVGSPATILLPARPLRRQPFSHELAASTDFAALDTQWESALGLLASEVRQLQQHQIDELRDAIVEAGDDLDAIAEISADPLASEVIAKRLHEVAELAATDAISEAERQGKTIARPKLDQILAALKTRAEVMDTQLTRDLTSSAVRRAVRLTGGSLEPDEVADEVAKGLRQLTGAAARDQLGGALTAAQNAGRGVVFRRGQPERIYASELLDHNTCSPCSGMDGVQYLNMDDAERDYPCGGFTECAGGDRCRGMLIAVYGENG